MFPSSFEYLRAGSLTEAINLLAKHGEDAKFLAGGHSLLPMMKLRMAQPRYLIDIGRIAELKYIREENGSVAIGALTNHAEVASSHLVSEKTSILAQAAGAIGDVQVRNRGTIGGSIAHADPAADYPAAILASEAQIVVQGPQGQRTIAAQDFFVDLFTTALATDELLVEIRVPIVAKKFGSSYLKFPHPASGYPVIGCAAMLSLSDGVCREARVAFTALANKAFRDKDIENALRDKVLDVAAIEVATAKVAKETIPLEDHFASGEYRRHLASVYARRALLEALSRCK